jgi:hypothetical protein
MQREPRAGMLAEPNCGARFGPQKGLTAMQLLCEELKPRSFP